MGRLTQRVCTVRVEVSIDNQPRYEATCQQRVPEVHARTAHPIGHVDR